MTKTLKKEIKMQNRMEQKFVDFSMDEIKAAKSDDGSMEFSGYGAYFNNVDSYGDIIVPGAFKNAVAYAKRTGDYPAMMVQHGAEGYTPVGVFTKMVEDEKGLYVEGKLADTERGREYYTLMKMEPRPAIKGMSIGYFTKKAEYPTDDNKRSFPKGCYRKILDVELVEISLVTVPANKKAIVTGVKSEFVIRDAEKALKEAGYSASEAKTIISIIKSTVMDDEQQPQQTIQQPTPPVESSDEQKEKMTEVPTPEQNEQTQSGEQAEEQKQTEEEDSKELKDLLNYLKDLENPKSSGLELSEEEQKSLSDWIKEIKQEEELIKLRDFLRRK